jgi:hypothetical protein
MIAPLTKFTTLMLILFFASTECMERVRDALFKEENKEGRISILCTELCTTNAASVLVNFLLPAPSSLHLSTDERHRVDIGKSITDLKLFCQFTNKPQQSPCISRVKAWVEKAQNEIQNDCNKAPKFIATLLFAQWLTKSQIKTPYNQSLEIRLFETSEITNKTLKDVLTELDKIKKAPPIDLFETSSERMQVAALYLVPPLLCTAGLYQGYFSSYRFVPAFYSFISLYLAVKKYSKNEFFSVVFLVVGLIFLAYKFPLFGTFIETLSAMR